MQKPGPHPRIISLIASSTEITCALGFEHLLVGRSHECDFPQSVRRLPVCTEVKFAADGTSYAIDQRIKAILQEGLSVYRVLAPQLDLLKPDLILTQTQCEVCAVSEKDVEAAVCQLVDSRPRIISLHPNALEDLWVDIRKVAQGIAQTGQPQAVAQGEELVSRLRARIDRIAQLASRASHRPTVGCIEWADPLMAAGNWVPELVELAGGTNLFGIAGKHSPFMDFAELLARDPEILILMPCGFGIPRSLVDLRLLEAREDWKRLRAVRDGRVYVVDGNQYFNRPGPRLVESLQILAEIFHPELFTPAHEGSGWMRPRTKNPRATSLAAPHEFYTDDRGRMVFTEAYHLRRGWCCGSGCRHCPYPK